MNTPSRRWLNARVGCERGRDLLHGLTLVRSPDLIVFRQPRSHRMPTAPMNSSAVEPVRNSHHLLGNSLASMEAVNLVLCKRANGMCSLCAIGVILKYGPWV